MLIRFGATLAARCNPMKIAIDNDHLEILNILKMYDNSEELDE